MAEDANYPAMEIPEHWFFSFWALINPTFTCLRFYALYKSELSTSVPPFVMSSFKNCLIASWFVSALLRAVCLQRDLTHSLHTSSLWFWIAFGIIFQSACSSMNRSSPYFPYLYIAIKVIWQLHLLPYLNTFTRWYPVSFVLCSIPAKLFPDFILPVINLLLVGRELYTNPPRDARLAFQMAVMTSLFLVGRSDERFLLCDAKFFVLYIACLFCIIDQEDFAAVGKLAAKMKGNNMGKFFEFAVGTVGALLFQNFFRLTSFSQVLPFLCFAVAWVANLAILRTSYDFGVFNFLVGNVVVGCTVNQFGLRGTTWLAYGAALLLYGLRLKIESITLVHRPNQPPQKLCYGKFTMLKIKRCVHASTR